MAKRFQQTFTKEDTQIANKLTKAGLTSLTIRKMKPKLQLAILLQTYWNGQKKKLDNTKC
jgi:hypothetical protein